VGEPPRRGPLLDESRNVPGLLPSGTPCPTSAGTVAVTSGEGLRDSARRGRPSLTQSAAGGAALLRQGLPVLDSCLHRCRSGEERPPVATALAELEVTSSVLCGGELRPLDFGVLKGEGSRHTIVVLPGQLEPTSAYGFS